MPSGLRGAGIFRELGSVGSGADGGRERMERTS